MLLINGGVICWGKNTVGQLGTGSEIIVLKPTAVNLSLGLFDHASVIVFICIVFRPNMIRRRLHSLRISNYPDFT